MLIQQGDVLFKSVKDIPTSAKPIKKTQRGYVLAEGEVTGHAHVITEEVDLWSTDKVKYLKNDSPVEVNHEEHNTVTIPKGTWEVGIVQEYDHFAEEAKNVAD